MSSRFLVALSICLIFASCNRPEDKKTAVADTEWEADLPDYIDPSWAKSNIWDDGRGEIVRYSCIMNLEDAQQSFEMTFISVKENFSRKRNAMTDGQSSSDAFEVIKHNQFATVKTEVFPYHFLNSFYFKRENVDLVHKATFSSQDWDGNSFKAINYSDGGYMVTLHSYLQEIGQEDMNGFPWFEDQLPFTLRSLKFKDGLSFKRKVMGSLMNNDVKLPQVYDAAFDVKLENGQWEVSVTMHEGKISYYYFYEAAPHIMKQMVTYDGRRMLMTSANRSKYWIAPIPADKRY